MSKLTQEERQIYAEEYNSIYDKKQMLMQRLQAIQVTIAKDEIERKAIYDEIEILNNEIKELNNNLSRIDDILEDDKLEIQKEDDIARYKVIAICVFCFILTIFFSYNTFVNLDNKVISTILGIIAFVNLIGFIVCVEVLNLSLWTVLKNIFYLFVVVGVVWFIVGGMNEVAEHRGSDSGSSGSSSNNDENERLKLLHLANAQLICDRYFLQNAKYDGAKTGNIAGTLDNDSKKTGYVFTDGILVNGFGAKKRVGYVCYISKNFDENTIGKITNEQDEITFQEHLKNGNYDKYIVDFQIDE